MKQPLDHCPVHRVVIPALQWGPVLKWPTQPVLVEPVEYLVKQPHTFIRLKPFTEQFSMDAMDILGALLGKKSGSSSRGGDILKDMMSGRSRQPSPSRAPVPHSSRRPRTIGDAAKGLEDLLNVSNDRHNQRRQAPASPPPQRQPPVEHQQMNDQAEILIRAMIGAAKSDGQITESEQQDILKRLDHVGQNEINFLRQEFAKPADARELAWTVPIGMEQQVYQISLIAIDLDEQKEAEYLADLAHGLRLDPTVCNNIHRKLGAPVIFQE